eukprot:246579-Chlamydomonas_euryale.AAC.1
MRDATGKGDGTCAIELWLQNASIQGCGTQRGRGGTELVPLISGCRTPLFRDAGRRGKGGGGFGRPRVTTFGNGRMPSCQSSGP